MSVVTEVTIMTGAWKSFSPELVMVILIMDTSNPEDEITLFTISRAEEINMLMAGHISLNKNQKDEKTQTNEKNSSYEPDLLPATIRQTIVQ